MVTATNSSAATSTTWRDRLAARGILDAAISAGWHDYAWFGTPGWAFPLYRADGTAWTLGKDAGVAAGRPARRWKALDSQHNPKYTWGYPDQSKDRGDVRQPTGCQYYWLPGGVKQHIEAESGALIVACGEPDMLTFASAEMRAVTSFFGEGSIPANIVDVFTQLGVKRVLYYPDNDHTGWDDAIKLIEAFKDSQIVVEVYAIPAEMSGYSVNDINDLWVALGFDRNLFLSAIMDAKPLNQVLQRVEKPAEDADTDALWQAEIDRYHHQIEEALKSNGALWKRPNGWGKALCIFAAHEHETNDPKTWQAGYHREKGQFRCFKCGQTWGRDEVADRLNIVRPKAPPRSTKPAAAGSAVAPTAPAPMIIPIYSSDQALARYRERLQGKNPLGHILWPFKAMHQFEGYCRVVARGKVIGVLGLSGGGKTSFLETLSDLWRQMGHSIIDWSPEWTWEERADRTVQRYGGATFTEMMLHEMWLSEDEAGVPVAQRAGVRMSDALFAKSMEIIAAIERWRGKAYYVDKLGANLEDLIAAMQSKLDSLTTVGCRPSVAIFDYIQLAEIAGARGDGERIPRAISCIKAFVTDNRLVGVVGTQARKDDSSAAREDHKLLTAEAAQYFRDDKTNLFITLNPEFDNEGNMTDRGVINIVKNSGGKRGKLAARPNPRYLRWDDVMPTIIDLSTL